MGVKDHPKNRLQHETSPYLKQHEHNPVDWFPWGEEALKKAKKENKPILLSVGYSACHWCHVMAHECFENPEVAKIMNDRYVNIKVDREERPDLDQIYQPVAQMITKGGGWPLTVFLTPDLKPFYGGTYFPPADRYGRPGFPRLLVALSDSFKNTPSEILERAEKITEIIQDSDDFSGNENFKDPSILKQNEFKLESSRQTLSDALNRLLTFVDWQNGGIGSAPKFPNPMIFHFLWRMSQMEWVTAKLRSSASEAVHITLQKMACGGIFDQLGGGFSRYSVDEHWTVPHFEKMLYDNALLLKLYSEVLLTSPELESDIKNLYLSVLEKTVGYLKHEMVSEEKMFYAAQDADSEGEEGKYFIFDRTELSEILTAAELDVFCAEYGVTELGNFEHGKTIFTRSIPGTVASLINSDAPTNTSRDLLVCAAEEKVLSARFKRIRPGLDSKVLVSWNGLMISGLSWTTLALLKFDRTDVANTAKSLAMSAFAELKERASFTDSGLSATIQEGQARLDGYLDDYAFLAQGALDLGRIDAANRKQYWADACAWFKKLHHEFKDDDGLGFYFTQAHASDLIHRPKSFFDQAIPSGNAVSFGLALTLDASNERLMAELSVLERSLLESASGLGELLNVVLLRAVGPVLVKGESPEASISPFCFFESDELVTGKTQFCWRESCQLESPIKKLSSAT